MIRETVLEINYSPMVIHSAFTLLMFLREDEVWAILVHMIKRSARLIASNSLKTDLMHLKWHFSLIPEDFSKLCKAFFGLISTKNVEFQEIFIHFTRLKFNYVGLFEHWCGRLFNGYLPFPVLKNN